MPRGKGKYPDLLRFRAPAELRGRIERILKAVGHGDDSEFMRAAVFRHVESEEDRLGLRPMIERLTRAAEKLVAAKAAEKKKQAARKRAA